MSSFHVCVWQLGWPNGSLITPTLFFLCSHKSIFLSYGSDTWQQWVLSRKKKILTLGNRDLRGTVYKLEEDENYGHSELYIK